VYTLAEGPRYGTSLILRVRQSGGEQTMAYTTTCERPNKAPVVAAALANQVLTVNVPASIAIPAGTFTDPDGTIASVTLTGLPVGLSYDPAKRLIQGTPTLIGTSPAVAKATDNGGASVSDTFLITVRVAPRFAVTTTLLDAQGKVLKDLIDADLLDSKKMPVLANLSCQPKVTTGSVLMELTGKARRTVYANAAPYLLYPSGQGFKPEVGSYQFKVSVFSGPNGTGTLLGTSTVRFDVVLANEEG
jgi:Putative Ig domain